MTDKDIYITDTQYLELLQRGLKNLDTLSNIQSCNSDTTGDKYTETNVGLCNPELVTKDTSMWPKDFPVRKVMKYLQAKHKCPLDWRKVSEKSRSGCFYTCTIFKKRITNLNEVKRLYNERISEVQTNG